MNARFQDWLFGGQAVLPQQPIHNEAADFLKVAGRVGANSLDRRRDEI
jgi:hypothetical protein